MLFLLASTSRKLLVISGPKDLFGPLSIFAKSGFVCLDGLAPFKITGTGSLIPP
jgi:hypothetical protein